MECNGYQQAGWKSSSWHFMPLIAIGMLVAISAGGGSFDQANADEQNAPASRKHDRKIRRLPPIEAWREPAPDRFFRQPRIAEPVLLGHDSQAADQSLRFPLVAVPTDDSFEEFPSVEAQESVGIAQQQAFPPAHRGHGTPGMEAVNRQADLSIKKGFDLAGRGAFYSARVQFIVALRTIADALDAYSETAYHAAALDAGLRALRESDDFRSSEAIASRPSLEIIVAAHRTPILLHLITDVPTGERRPSRIVATQRYYTYAQQQLTVAAGREASASRALYGLGKTCLALQQARGSTIVDARPKAIVLHQAALMVDKKNYMAANEVGVLMVRCGRYHAARRAMQHAAANSNQAVVWRNLSIIHQYLGEPEWAARAQLQVKNVLREKRLQSGASNGRNLAARPQQSIVWLDSPKFAATSKFESDANANASKANANKTKNRVSPRAKAPKAAWRLTPSWFSGFESSKQ